MIKEIIYELKSPYRDTMRITAYRFGDIDNPNCEKTMAIVGATRGNEAQQMYNCSQLIAFFKAAEAGGRIEKGKSIVVIPTINNFSINIEKRFWAMDNTDINRMFPGYDKGETTQRIAYAVFEYVKEYEFGIHFTSFYIPGRFTPHVRMMRTGYENIDLARDFGLPYVFVRNSRPYDTTTLNYNWQIFGTNAFSLYMGKTSRIDENAGALSVRTVERFLIKQGVLTGELKEGEKSKLINSRDMVSIRTEKAGVLHKCTHVGDMVTSGTILGYILDPYEGDIIQTLTSPSNGKIFYTAYGPYVYEGSRVFRIVKEDMYK